MTNTPIVLSVVNTLLAFTFGNMEVHSAIIDGKFWFCADDVCEALGIQDKTEALTMLRDDEKCIAEFYPNDYFKRLRMLMINKQGLFALTLSHNTEIADTFSYWLTHIVLPALTQLARNDLSTHEPDNDENSMKLKEVNIQAAKNWLELLERENDTLTDEARTDIANEIFRLVTGRDMNCSI